MRSIMISNWVKVQAIQDTAITSTLEVAEFDLVARNVIKLML